MPESQQPIKGRDMIVERIAKTPWCSVLDIGAGDGKWGKLLAEHVYKITGLEVWQDSIVNNKLNSIYDGMIQMDAREFEGWDGFDVVILGDVLEHLPYDDAVAFVERLKAKALDVYLTIPISECIQDGTVYGNPFETHLYQWTDKELVALGFKQLHAGPNPNGKVMIGTYLIKGWNED